MGVKNFRHMGMWSCLYFVTMLFSAEIIGISIAVIVKPGLGNNMVIGSEHVDETDAKANSIMAFLILIKTLIPENIITGENYPYPRFVYR